MSFCSLPIQFFFKFIFFFSLETSVGCKRVSSDEDFSLVHEICETSEPLYDMNDYVAVLVEKKSYIGLITDVDIQEQEADLMLLHPPLPAHHFTWSEDTFWVYSTFATHCDKS